MTRHERCPLRVRRAVVLVLGGLVALLAVARAAEEDEVLRWIEDVVLGPEYGGSGAICARWVRTPTLSVVEAPAPECEMIAACVEEINRALARTSIREIRIDRPGNLGADILVYCVRQKEFPALARKHAFQYVEGNLGYFWTFWNDRHEINSGIVLLASDRLTAETFRHFALEEITQVLGLSGDSPVFAESVFYSQGNDGGRAEHLSSLDVKLIDFFYRQIPPGSRTAEVRIAYWRHWGRD